MPFLTQRNSLPTYDDSGNTQGNAAGWICGGYRRGCEILILYIYSTLLTRTQILCFPYFQGGSPSRSEQTTHSVALAIPVTRSVLHDRRHPLMPVEKAPHEHVILEFLFRSVFESRFINMKPTGSFQSLRMKSQVADFR